MGWSDTIGYCRCVGETCSYATCFMYHQECCGAENCEPLPEENEMGTREDLLRLPLSHIAT